MLKIAEMCQSNCSESPRLFILNYLRVSALEVILRDTDKVMETVEQSKSCSMAALNDGLLTVISANLEDALAKLAIRT